MAFTPCNDSDFVPRLSSHSVCITLTSWLPLDPSLIAALLACRLRRRRPLLIEASMLALAGQSGPFFRTLRLCRNRFGRAKRLQVAIPAKSPRLTVAISRLRSAAEQVGCRAGLGRPPPRSTYWAIEASVFISSRLSAS